MGKRLLAAAAVLCTALHTGAPYALAAPQTVRTTLRISESDVIKPSDPRLLGLSGEWQDANRHMVEGHEGNVLAPSADFIETLAELGLKIPQMRQAGASSQTFRWKDSIGPLDQRGYTLEGTKIRYGVLEMVQNTLLTDQNADFLYTVNLSDSEEDLADLVRFLLLSPDDPGAVGADGVNWAQKRVDYGFPAPVAVDAFELGNETDGSSGWATDALCIQNANAYIALCRRAMNAMRAVRPDLRFAIHSKSYAASKPAHGELWNKTVIREIGAQAAYVALHEYYHTGTTFYWTERSRIDREISDMINSQISDASKRPKIIITEHAIWSDSVGNNQQVPAKAKTTSLQGALTVGEFVNRMLWRKDIATMNYFALLGSRSNTADYGGLPFCIWRPFEDGGFYMTGIGELYKALYEGFGENVVKTALSGNHAYWQRVNDDSRGLLTASAQTTKGGGLTITFVNQNSSVAHDCTVITEGAYQLEKETLLTADSLYADNTPVTPEGLYAKTRLIQATEAFASYTVPPQSVVVLTLVPSGHAYPEEKNGALTITQTGDAMRIAYAPYDNKAFAGAKELALLVAAPGQSLDGLTMENVPQRLAAMTQSGVRRQRTVFHISLPKNAKAGEYHARIVNGGNFEDFTFVYTPAPDQERADWTASVVNDQVSLTAALPAAAEGKAVRLTVARGAYTSVGEVPAEEVVYLSFEQGRQGENVFLFRLPDEAVSGVYTVFAAYGGAYGGKDEGLFKQFSYIRSAGDLSYTARVVRKPGGKGALVLPLQYSGGGPPAVTVFAALYDEDFSLLSLRRIKNIPLTQGENQVEVPLGNEDVFGVRLFLWDGEGGIQPLERPYFLTRDVREVPAL